MADHHDCCGGGDHQPDCSLHPANDRSAEFSLYTKIDWSQFNTLNESITGSGKNVFKPWDRRLSEEFVESEIDGDLIFNIPFTGEVKLMGMIVIGGSDLFHPTKVRIFKEFRDFDDVAGEAAQEFDLHPDPKGVAEYPLKTTRFNNVTTISLHFPGNYGGGDATQIFYIGLRGEHKAVNRNAITIANYELAPSLADHKNALDQGVPHVL